MADKGIRVSVNNKSESDYINGLVYQLLTFQKENHDRKYLVETLVIQNEIDSENRNSILIKDVCCNGVVPVTFDVGSKILKHCINYGM